MEDKFCPLLGISPEITNPACDKEKCAWWDPVFSQCAILTIAGELRKKDSYRKPVKTALVEKNKS